MRWRARVSSVFTLALVAGSGLVVPAGAQPQPTRGCVHTTQETTMQRERRLEAIQAMRLIDRVAGSRIPAKPHQRWDEVVDAPLLRSLNNDGSAEGDLARKIRWAEVEPLPGWRMIWLDDRVVPTFSLTDVWDPCRFTLSSEDRAVIPTPRGRVIPLQKG